MKNFKAVIMFSGGIDSNIMYELAKSTYKPSDIGLIWFNVNQPYYAKELTSINNFELKNSKEVIEIKIDLIRKEFSNIPTLTKEIIPGRNLIMGSIASSFAPIVMMGALKGEMHDFMRDKNKKFLSQSSKLFSYVYGEDKKFIAPLSKFSKAEAIKKYVDMTGESLDFLAYKTASCYHPVYDNCGYCNTCFKKNVAFLLNGFQVDFKRNPWISCKDMIVKYINAIDNKIFNHYSKNRIRETQIALRSYVNLNPKFGEIELYKNFLDRKI